MMIIIFSLIFAIIGVVSVIYTIKISKNTTEINNEVKQKNEEIIKENTALDLEKQQLITDILRNRQELDNIQKSIVTNQEAAATAYEKYCDVLNMSYLQVEKDYDNLLNTLYERYDNKQEELLEQQQEEREKLDYLRSTRTAAIQAQIKEKEIKEQASFYCLQPTANELDDIRALERVKPNLHQPRILCMLIWSTYFQKPMTALCNNILGTSIVCGIYKITNQETGECYIGQAIDIAKRWKDHAKCGLGVDTPANNKLYKAIQEYGIWSFTWELLEKCSKEDLNDKENFYIELYDSYNYGYNSNKGIKKS